MALLVLALAVTYAIQDYINSFDSGLAPGPRIRVQNATTMPLRIGEVWQGSTHVYLGLAAGATETLRGPGEMSASDMSHQCLLGTLVAWSGDGREIARRAPGLCAGETWVITAPSPGAS